MSALIDFDAVLAAAERLQAELDFPDCTCRAADGCATWAACRCSECSKPGKHGEPQGFRAREERGHFDQLLPCRHVRAASKAADAGAFPAAHLPETEWLAYVRGVGRLLALADPAGYAEPPPCLAPGADRLRRRAIVNTYVLRRQAGVSLYHTRDPWRKKGDHVLHVATTSPGRSGNGVRLVEEALCLVSKDNRKKPDLWPYEQTPEPSAKYVEVFGPETPKRREWRERENRCNKMLLHLQQTGQVDYASVYGEAKAEEGAA